MSLKLGLLVSALALLSACASQPVQFDESKNQGTWQAKVQVKDLKTNKADILSLEVIAIKDEAMRMEITGTLGARLASLLMKQNEISYAVHTQKKYYRGVLSEKSLKPLLRVDLDPRWLYAAFFDRPVAGWECVKGEKGLVQKCSQKNGMEINWSERQGENKRVLIKGSDFEMNVLVKDFTTKVQNADKAFSLEAPPTYKRYKLL